MRLLEGDFAIVCKCGRKNVNFAFTEDDDIVIFCKTCCRTILVERGE